jgi:hypothetical protein
MSAFGTIGVLAALQASAAAAVVDVESDSSCPSAKAVREVLDALGGRDAPRSASVSVRNHGDKLTVEFTWPGEAQSETRELAVESDCEARAQAAAVVVASWLGILPGVALVSSPLGSPPVEIESSKIVPPTPPTPPPVEPSHPKTASAAPAPIAEANASVEPSHPEPVSVAAASVPEALAPVAAPRAWEPRRSWLGIGLEGSAGGGVVPGLRFELAQVRGGTGFDFGWIASTLVAMPRSKSIDGGTSKWIRPAIGIAGLASWRSNRVQLGLDLGPLIGMTVAWGSGYPTNDTDASITWGLTGGLRMQLVANARSYWIELRVIDWMRTESLQHEVLPSGPSGSVELPSFEGLLSLGWSFAL